MIDPADFVTIKTADDVTPEILELAVECAFGSDMMGNRPGIDWEYAYDMLESVYGIELTEFDGPADRKIRAEVRRQRRAGRTE